VTPPLAPTRSFDDADEFAEALRGWNLWARKLERGPFRAELHQVERGPLRLVHLRLSGPLELEGSAPQGVLSFGMPTRRSPPARWCAREASASTISLYGDEDAFEAATRAGFESLVLSVATPTVSSVAEELGLDGSPRGLGREVVGCNPERLAALRSLAQRELLSPAPARAPEASERLTQELTRALLTTLAPADPRAPASVRAATVARALSHIAAFRREALTVGDLCRATGASERTLRRAFVEHFGLSPKAYLQARRLHGVRDELRHADPARARVADVAQAWSFWHLGQFASDYRRLFGELPSQTLSRRTSPARAGRLEARA
jgi:AraC family ethanolamine operon transcriptional activator